MVEYAYVQEYKDFSFYKEGYLSLEKLLNRNIEVLCNSHISSIANSIDNEEELINACLESDTLDNTLNYKELIDTCELDSKRLIEAMYNGEEEMFKEEFSSGKLELIDMLACCKVECINVYEVDNIINSKKEIIYTDRLNFNKNVEEYILNERYIKVI